MVDIMDLQRKQGNSAILAIRRKCLDCCGNQSNVVRVCSSVNCPLWMFRLGKLPFVKNSDLDPLLKASNLIGAHSVGVVEMNKRFPYESGKKE